MVNYRWYVKDEEVSLQLYNNQVVLSFNCQISELR